MTNVLPTATASDPTLRPCAHFDGARDAAQPRERQREITKRAHALREEMLAGPQVLFYKTVPLVRVPYPVEYGFWRASDVRTPLVHIINRLIIVQLQSRDGVKTLLISPSDPEANKETPFFKQLAKRARLLGTLGERLLAPRLGSVEEGIAAAGIRPEDVDYISYDHLHTQDLRRWLGSTDRPPFFPNAKLLVMRQEWESARGLLPIWDQWYCPGGIDGIDPERLLFLDGDVMLGQGVAIVRTPGHTEGNHSFVVHTPEGLLVTSENGISADNYAPRHSRIKGVAKWARRSGSEIVLNGNTLEAGIDQYLSMIQEREIAGPSARNPDFYNVYPSSELASYWAFPGIKPTFSFGDLEFGTPVVKAKAEG